MCTQWWVRKQFDYNPMGSHWACGIIVLKMVSMGYKSGMGHYSQIYGVLFHIYQALLWKQMARTLLADIYHRFCPQLQFHCTIMYCMFAILPRLYMSLAVGGLVAPSTTSGGMCRFDGWCIWRSLSVTEQVVQLLTCKHFPKSMMEAQTRQLST